MAEETYGDLSKMMISEAKRQNKDKEKIAEETVKNIYDAFGDGAVCKEENGYLNVYFKDECTEKLLENIEECAKIDCCDDFTVEYVSKRLDHLLKDAESSRGCDQRLRKAILGHYYCLETDRDVFTGEKKKLTEKTVQRIREGRKRLAAVFYERDRLTVKYTVDIAACDALKKIIG